MSSIAKYIKKADEINAVQWNGIDSLKELDLIFEGDWVFTVDRKTLRIHTTSDSGPLTAEQSDYIVVENSTVYVVPQEIFRKKYEKIPTTVNGSGKDWWIPATNPFSSSLTTAILGNSVVSTKLECDDCLDVSKDTETFAQKTACFCCGKE